MENNTDAAAPFYEPFDDLSQLFNFGDLVDLSASTQNQNASEYLATTEQPMQTSSGEVSFQEFENTDEDLLQEGQQDSDEFKRKADQSPSGKPKPHKKRLIIFPDIR